MAPSKHLCIACSFATLLLGSSAAIGKSVEASNLKITPYLVLPTEADLLNPAGTVNLSSPYLAGVGGTGAYSGVGTLEIVNANTPSGYANFCTGSLISSRVVLTAAHCLAEPAEGAVSSIKFSLPNGRPLFGVSPSPNPGVPQVFSGSGYIVHPTWDADSFAGDIAMVRLSAPVVGTDIYDIFRGDPMGQEFTMVGTGTAGWGDVGADSDTGFAGGLFDLRKRVGQNIFEHYGPAFFEALNQHFGLDLVSLGGPNEGILLFDSDSGKAQNDVFGLLAEMGDPNLAAIAVKQTGLLDALGRLIETNTAPGDSGGPAFIDGKIAGVTGFGITGAILTFDPNTGFIYCGEPTDIDVSFNPDTDSCTDSSFGEISGDTNVAYYQDFIDGVLGKELAFVYVPEPASAALVMGGIAAIGVFRKRRAHKS